ncbi:MAG: hypothetical protein GY851_16970 [bacterium]|nr:hypothetical protein [bacterium]
MEATATRVEHWDEADIAEAVGPGIALVEFYARWSVLGDAQARVLDRVAEICDDTVRIGRVDVDTATTTLARLGIADAPTLVLFRDGREHARFVGMQPSDVLINALRALVRKQAMLACYR